MKNNIVRMADGSERSISCIRIGDRVMSEEGKMPMVQNIYRGRETTYYEIKAFDYAPIKVTADAVFMTNNGVKSVKELNFDDALLMEESLFRNEKIYAEIESISYINKKMDTYELELEGSSMYFENQYMVGDFAQMMHHKRACK